MITNDVLPRWLFVTIIYGGIGIFVGPLLHLFIYGEHWVVFTVLKVVISVSAFFFLAHAIAYSLGNYWIAGVLSLIFMAIFFWRPIDDLISGPQEVTGNLVVMKQIDIYIMRTSYDIEHNIIFVSDIVEGDGKRTEIRSTPSQLDSLQEQERACPTPTFTLLKNMRKVLTVSCSNNTD